MIKFDKNKFHSDYVYVKKITQNYIYVLTDVNGHVYNKKNVVKGYYQGKKVSKVKIHNATFFNYVKHNSIREFYGSGRLGCISFYDDKVINIEIQKIDFKTGRYIDPSVWKSTFESVIDRTNEIVPDNQTAYIDGKEIFWLSSDSKRNISPDSCFSLHEVNYLDIARIGVQIEKKDNKDKKIVEPKIETSIQVATVLGLGNNRSLEDLKKLNFKNNKTIKNEDSKEEKDSVAFVKTGVILSYNPLEGINEDIVVYSPVLKRNENASSKSKKVKNELIDILSLVDKEDNKTYFNLNFVLKSASVIGELYGYDEADFLNIPEIIQNTGVICLNKIDDNSRKNYAVNLDKWECLSWLFKFIYSENDLYKMLDLNKLFKYIMNNGIVSEKNISDVFLEGKTTTDISLYIPKQIDWKKLKS